MEARVSKSTLDTAAAENLGTKAQIKGQSLEFPRSLFSCRFSIISHVSIIFFNLALLTASPGARIDLTVN